MAGEVSLNDLIEALSNAVIEAQDRIEQHQISNISRYFDEDNRPISVNVKLPSLDPNSEEEDVNYRLPLLALVSNNPLRIKDVEISFDADIGEIGGSGESADSNAKKAWSEENAAKAVQVDMRSGLLRKDRKTAHVVLRVEGGDPTEGMSRLIHHLLKLI